MIQILQRNLAAKLLLAFAVVIVVGIGSVAVLANQRTTAEFDTYLSVGQQMAASHLADTAASAYGQSGSWEAVARAIEGWSVGPVGHIVVVDRSGMVVVDTTGQWRGRSARDLVLSGGTPIVVQDQTVGTLYALSGASGPLFAGRGGPPFGPMAGGMMGSGTPVDTLSQAESSFLDRVNRSLVLAAIGASLVALIISALLARRITRPLRDLARAARRIAQGHLDERIAVGGADEVGQLAQAFNQMAESLAQTEEARRQLVADVAHELRTPLAVVQGTMQAMREGVLPRDDPTIDAVREEVDNLVRLVADLRDLSLGDVGQFSVQRRSLDLSPVIEQTAAAFGAEAVAHQVSFSVDLAPGLPRLVGDEDRLRQTLRNLTANALHHTPPNGDVTVQARALEGWVEIKVRDTGEGIAPEHLPRVFERFYRADPSRARESGGTGLGLAIVEQIVQAHGGEITAHSDGLGQGATFSLRLPIAGLDRLPAGAPCLPSSETTEAARSLR